MQEPIFGKSKDKELTVSELAEALYEGSAHLSNLAEKLVRQHGQASALSFYHLMGEEVHTFWKDIAERLIAHAKEWQPNDGCCCVLSERERTRLRLLAEKKGPERAGWSGGRMAGDARNGAWGVCGRRCV